MKHRLLLILFSILGLIQPTHAQYRTLDLFGTWELVSLTGEYPGFTMYIDGYPGTWDNAPANFKYMYLGIMLQEPNYPTKLYGLTSQQTEEVTNNNGKGNGCFYFPRKTGIDDISCDLNIMNFCITDGNMLPMTYEGGYTSIWIIESLTDEELILKGLDDMCRVVYKRVENSATDVNEVAVDETPTQYYNLNGMAVDNPSKGIYIAKSGKSVQKILNTNQ
ncbi:MAG: hypothetical protein K2H86_01035 [Muribaculaceae bacterium]|nr:hypothetical protein [Muribaculaceae bacterium]